MTLRFSTSNGEGSISLSSFIRGPVGPAGGDGIVGGKALAVNLNSANTDTPVTMNFTAGSKYVISAIYVVNVGTTASLTTATIGVFSATGGAGLALAGNQALSGITSNAVDTDHNALSLTITVASRTALDASTLQVRVGTAQGAAATADVFIICRVLA